MVVAARSIDSSHQVMGRNVEPAEEPITGNNTMVGPSNGRRFYHTASGKVDVSVGTNIWRIHVLASCLDAWCLEDNPFFQL